MGSESGSDSYTIMETSKEKIASPVNDAPPALIVGSESGSDSYTIMETSKEEKTSPVNDAPPTTMTFINSNFFI